MENDSFIHFVKHTDGWNTKALTVEHVNTSWWSRNRWLLQDEGTVTPGVFLFVYLQHHYHRLIYQTNKMTDLHLLIDKMSSRVRIPMMRWNVSSAVRAWSWLSGRAASLLSCCRFCVYRVLQQKAVFIFLYQDNCSLMQRECNLITLAKQSLMDVFLRPMCFVNRTGKKNDVLDVLLPYAVPLVGNFSEPWRLSVCFFSLCLSRSDPTEFTAIKEEIEGGR